MIKYVKLGDVDPKGKGQNKGSNTEYCNKSWTAWSISSKFSQYIDYKDIILKNFVN